jgi:signal transduction histidine kinase
MELKSNPGQPPKNSMSDLQASEQKRELERLKILYSISQKLASFKNVEDSFTEIVGAAAECFPLISAVVIEHWDEVPNTAAWISDKAVQGASTEAIVHAKHAYSYLARASSVESNALLDSKTLEKQLIGSDKTMLFYQSEKSHYITIPLIIDELPPLGILQLEGTASMDEKDLAFVSAMANLVSVALDRYYKTRKDLKTQQDEASKNLFTLYHTKDKVVDMESEREQREAFVSLLIHDLRTPLTIVLGSAQMILRHPENIQSTKKSAQQIVTHANRVGQMITSLLDANRIRSGEKLQVHKEKIDITKLIETTLSELSLIHGKRFIFDQTASVECYVDPRGVRRIIENLCTNAIKYGANTTPVNIILKHTPQEVSIAVCNEGNVISAEDQKSLFQQFQRIHAVELSKTRGWGIGLVLVRGVAEAHGGKATVKSDASGTVFTVTLPRFLGYESEQG